MIIFCKKCSRAILTHDENCRVCEVCKKLDIAIQLLRELDAEIDYWRDEEKHKRLKEILGNDKQEG
jgi:hypothetical protein